MRYCRKKMKYFLLVLTVVSMLFSMYGIVTPRTKINTSGGADALAGADLGQARTQPLRLNNKYYIQSLSDKELAADVINSFISKSSKQLKSLAQGTAFAALVPVIGLWIALACKKFSNVRKQRTCSVLAFSLGGHAPPGR